MQRVTLTVDERANLRRTIEHQLSGLCMERSESESRLPGSPGRSDREQSAEDAAQRSDDDEIAAALTAKCSAEIGALRRALLVIDTPGYGICIDCHLPIPVVRLQHEPQGVRCAACQEKAEN